MKIIPSGRQPLEMIAYGGCKLSDGFPTDKGGINLGHPGFETNTVHRCVENHILNCTKWGNFFPSCSQGKKKSKWSLETRAFVIFLSD